jgi:hypothetical protein
MAKNEWLDWASSMRGESRVGKRREHDAAIEW